MTNLTIPEECAMKLLRLCASPGKSAKMEGFFGMKDASDNDYTSLFHELRRKGRIHYGEASRHAVITIL